MALRFNVSLTFTFYFVQQLVGFGLFLCLTRFGFYVLAFVSRGCAFLDVLLVVFVFLSMFLYVSVSHCVYCVWHFSQYVRAFFEIACVSGACCVS